MKSEPSPLCSNSNRLFLHPSLNAMLWGTLPIFPKIKSAQSSLLGVKNVIGNPGQKKKKKKKSK